VELWNLYSFELFVLQFWLVNLHNLLFTSAYTV